MLDRTARKTTNCKETKNYNDAFLKDSKQNNKSVRNVKYNFIVAAI